MKLIFLSALLGALAMAAPMDDPDCTYKYKRGCDLTVRERKAKAQKILADQKAAVEAEKQRFRDMKANTEKIKKANRDAQHAEKQAFLDAQRAAFDENRAPEILAHLTRKMGLRGADVTCYPEADAPSEMNGSVVSFAVSGESAGSWYAIATGATGMEKPANQRRVLNSQMFQIDIADGDTATSDYGRFTGKAWVLKNDATEGSSVSVSSISTEYTGDQLTFYYCQE